MAHGRYKENERTRTLNVYAVVIPVIGGLSNTDTPWSVLGVDADQFAPRSAFKRHLLRPRHFRLLIGRCQLDRRSLPMRFECRFRTIGGFEREGRGCGGLMKERGVGDAGTAVVFLWFLPSVA